MRDLPLDLLQPYLDSLRLQQNYHLVSNIAKEPLLS